VHVDGAAGAGLAASIVRSAAAINTMKLPPFTPRTCAQLFVPVHATRTMFYGIFFSQDGAPVDERRSAARITSCRHQGFTNQDMASRASMGPVVDRKQEHLGASGVARAHA
jgi:hypothetical protein